MVSQLAKYYKFEKNGKQKWIEKVLKVLVLFTSVLFLFFLFVLVSNLVFLFFRGITEADLQLQKFRFNKSFMPIQSDNFLKDLMNDVQVIKNFQPLNSLAPGSCTGVKYTAMNANVLNMTFFDIFKECNIVYGDDGYIKQNYEETVMGMSLGDRLRQVLVFEDYDDFDTYDLIHSDKYQKEFIFKLFQHISLGGSVCQYE